MTVTLHPLSFYLTYTRTRDRRFCVKFLKTKNINKTYMLSSNKAVGKKKEYTGVELTVMEIQTEGSILGASVVAKSQIRSVGQQVDEVSFQDGNLSQDVLSWETSFE